MRDFSVTVRDSIIQRQAAAYAPLMLEVEVISVLSIRVVDSANDIIEVTLRVDNMMRSGLRYAVALKRPFGTRTLRRQRINLSKLPDYDGGMIQWLRLDGSRPSAAESLSFVNEYLQVNMKMEDLDLSVCRFNGNPLFLKVSDQSPFYKGFVQVNLV